MQLLPHQVAHAGFLAGVRFAGDFSEPGTGKTLTALTAAGMVRAGSLLVIAPPIALPMWQEMIEKYLELEAQILRTGAENICETADAIVCSYAIATKRCDELKDFDVLICDESHALKTHDAARTIAILGPNGIANTCGHAWMLSGTPVTRYADDWYPFLMAADGDRTVNDIGGDNLERFRLKYCIQQNRKMSPRVIKRIVVASRNLDQLHNLIYRDPPLAVRVTMKEVGADMPPLTFTSLFVELDKSTELSKATKALKGIPISQVQKLLYQKDDPLATMRRLLGVAKAPAVAKLIIERLADDPTPILVGAWHHDVMDALQKELYERKHYAWILSGETGSRVRNEVIEGFNSGEVPILIGQISAMGVSLNLQQLGHRILTIEEDFSPALMEQFYARLWRMGQKRHVHVENCRSNHPLDEAVARILSRKAMEHAKTLEIIPDAA